MIAIPASLRTQVSVTGRLRNERQPAEVSCTPSNRIDALLGDRIQDEGK